LDRVVGEQGEGPTVAIKEAKVPRSFPDRPGRIESRSIVGRAAGTLMSCETRRPGHRDRHPARHRPTTRYRRHQSPGGVP
jgi:hypothetical protein